MIQSTQFIRMDTIKKKLRTLKIDRRHTGLRCMDGDVVDFYFYFSNENDAKNLKIILEGYGFEVLRCDPSTTIINEWVLIVSKKILEKSLYQVCEQFDMFAKRFNGFFDGYEMGL